MFADRTEAGKQLAEKLYQYLDGQSQLDGKSNLLVVGLPRGGVPVALEVARKFCCPLEIIVSKKLPYPGQPEYAMGAVSSDGVVVFNPDIPQDRNWQAYIAPQRQALLERTGRIERKFYERAMRGKSSFEDKTVIVVDDGIATGMTAFAALETARQRGARRTVMAAPVIAPQAYERLGLQCDDVVALTVPAALHSVGQYYANFDQTSDQEVIDALRQSARFAHNSAPLTL
jgi:putative phosphoribosyl transferase